MSVNKEPQNALAASPSANWPNWFALGLGFFLGFCLIKFGNPVVLDHLITQPPIGFAAPASNFQAGQTADQSTDPVETFFEPWSMKRGLGLFALVVVAGLFAGKWKPWKPPAGKWILLLPLVWFGWQLLASATSVNANLTRITLLHFGVCITCFYLGWHACRSPSQERRLWIGLTIGLVLILWRGFGQHYGGLEALEKYIQESAATQSYPPEFIQRVAKRRIFSTLVYPNAFAGAILLLMPAACCFLWQILAKIPAIYQGVLTGLLAYSCTACLVWTGSKSGWIIALVMIVIAALITIQQRRLRLTLVVSVLVIGFAAFFIRYAGYFQSGATSVVARLDYWRAALQITKTYPLFGTGPGTFSVPYQKIKDPKPKWARLVHNDYLEQACDSGLPGFFAYIVLISGILYQLYRKLSQNIKPMQLAIWLGLLGWAMQGMVEFGLYIPALAWPAFTLMGWEIAPENPKLYR